MHRHKEHEKNIKYIESAFPDNIFTEIEALDREIRGLKMLQIFKEKLL